MFPRSPGAIGEDGPGAPGRYASQWSAIVSVAAKMGCTADTLRGWIRQYERDAGKREGVTTAEGAHQIA